MHECERVKSLSRVQLFSIPQTVAHQTPLSMGFSRQEHWSGLLFPSPGDLPNPAIEPRSPALQADSLPTDPPEKPNAWLHLNNYEFFFHITFWIWCLALVICILSMVVCIMWDNIDVHTGGQVIHLVNGWCKLMVSINTVQYCKCTFLFLMILTFSFPTYFIVRI